MEIADKSATRLEDRNEQAAWLEDAEVAATSLDDEDEPAAWLEEGEESAYKVEDIEKSVVRQEQDDEPTAGLEGEVEPSTWLESATRMENGEKLATWMDRGAGHVARSEDGEELATWMVGGVGSSTRMENGDELATGLDGGAKSAARLEDGEELSTWPPPCHNTTRLFKKLYIDDLTLLEKISLKDLIQKERIIGPLNYHDRFNLMLPPQRSILQHQICDLKIFTTEHHMKLNSRKTKCMLFINSLTKDFMPLIRMDNEDCLEVIYQLKLVGLVINTSLNWTDHIDYTVKRVNKILWQVTRFRQLGAPREKLVTLYILKVRSVLMFGAVTFHSSLTQELSRRLELQQKKALKIILGPLYRSYRNALDITALPRLDTLREEMCLKWALKAELDPKHSALFPRNESTVDTRNRKEFKEYFCHSAKYFNSAIPSMTRSLNDYYANKAS